MVASRSPGLQLSHTRLDRFQMRSVASTLMLHRYSPRGSKETNTTSPWWPVSEKTLSLFSMSTISILLSLLAIALAIRNGRNDHRSVESLLIARKLMCCVVLWMTVSNSNESSWYDRITLSSHAT